MPKKRISKEKEIFVVHGSENVFADLNLPNAEELMIKARIASALADVITAMGLTQARAAEMLGIDQPKVSMLLRGRLKDFSVDRLLRFLILLKQDIRIVISPHDKRNSQRVDVRVA